MLPRNKGPPIPDRFCSARKRAGIPPSRQTRRRKHTMVTKSPAPLSLAKPGGPTRLKAERIQFTLQSLPGWKLGSPKIRVERSFRLPSESETDRFVPFVVTTCREEGTAVEIAVRQNLVTVRLGVELGVTGADMMVAESLNASDWSEAAVAAAV
jgi:pterin-4a-carbinolamine dehydratase